jgi:hypothetical protein
MAPAALLVLMDCTGFPSRSFRYFSFFFKFGFGDSECHHYYDRDRLSVSTPKKFSNFEAKFHEGDKNWPSRRKKGEKMPVTAFFSAFR